MTPIDPVLVTFFIAAAINLIRSNSKRRGLFGSRFEGAQLTRCGDWTMILLAHISVDQESHRKIEIPVLKYLSHFFPFYLVKDHSPRNGAVYVPGSSSLC